MNSYSSETTKPLYRATQAVWFMLTIIETLLILRFMLKVFGADPIANFSRVVYGSTEVLIAPFFNVFHATDISGIILEWTTLLAILIYWLIAEGAINFY